jgi:predicted P-loop ATPase
MLTIDDLPDVKFTVTGGHRQSQPLTMNNVRKVMAHMDIVIRYDMMRAAAAFFRAGVEVPAVQTGLVVEVMSDIMVKLDINNLSRLDGMLTEIAAQDPFHPMQDWLESLEWDGVDRVDTLADSIVTDTDLWPVYLENWLVQVVAGVCGWRKGNQSLPHVLVLVGGQGVGKTRWLGNLGGQWVKTEAELHLASPSGKDHQIEALKFPMVELSELDGIFRKSDISHMKAFISRDFDSIRAPYARRAVQRPRVTSFCGSVNDAEFLTDSSGSRRFWPVQVDGIDWGFEMDWAQLWAQAYSFWCESADFNLTPVEDAERAQVSLEQHTTLPPEVEMLQAYWNAHKHVEKSYVAMNGVEILAMLGYQKVWSKTVGDAKRWLVDSIGQNATIDGKQRAWLFPYNEFARDRATWPKPINLTLIK